MKKYHKIQITAALILVLSGIFFLPIEIQYTVESTGKIVPSQQWILSQGNDGQLLANSKNFATGLNNSYQFTSFERGKSISLNLDQSLVAGKVVAKGDTLGVIYSTSQHENLIQLNGELQVLKAELAAGLSGVKKTEVQESQERLALAKSELNKQDKIVQRQKELLREEIITQEEYQIAMDDLNILLKAVDVRQAELESSTSGVKNEEINKLNKQIMAIENEISFLKQQIDSENLITAPFRGRIERTFSNDTLISISSIKSGVALIPVPLEAAAYIGDKSSISFDSAFGISSLKGNIQMKNHVMHLIGGKQCIIVTGTVEPLSDDFVSGIIAKAEIACDLVSLPTYLERNILN